MFFFRIDFGRRHKQLSDWVRRGIVPNPNSEPLVGRGQLTSVWLGGLANPGALITSLRHEKAAMLGCAVDEVWLNLRRCTKPFEESGENRRISVLSLMNYVESAKITNNLVQPLASRSQPPNLPFFSAK